MIGGTLRLGLPINDEITFSPRYSIYSSDISIPNNSWYPYNDCTNPIPVMTPGHWPTARAISRLSELRPIVQLLDQWRSLAGAEAGGGHDAYVDARLLAVL